MQQYRVSKAELQAGFEVIMGSDRSQAALMVLEPGSVTGGPDNRHPYSDQWLFVIEGSGRATVEEKEVEVGAGHLLLIEAGETHQIANTGVSSLRTLNVYAPPAY